MRGHLEIKADIAVSEDNELSGKRSRLSASTCVIGPGGESRYVRDTGAGTDAQKDAIAAQQSIIAGVHRHMDSFRLHESSFAHNQLRAARFEIDQVQLGHSPSTMLRLRRATPVMSTFSGPVTTLQGRCLDRPGKQPLRIDNIL